VSGSAGEAGTCNTPDARGSARRFVADSVRFAFAGPDFQWDAVGWDGILIQTLYRPGAAGWDESIRMAEHAIRHFSERLYRYPYPHATTIEGPIAGMEYPMLTFVAGTDRENLHFTLMHELGHEWYPMLVGSGACPWMDEGQHVRTSAPRRITSAARRTATPTPGSRWRSTRSTRSRGRSSR
jgi:hypothetical protein